MLIFSPIRSFHDSVDDRVASLRPFTEMLDWFSRYCVPLLLSAILVIPPCRNEKRECDDLRLFRRGRELPGIGKNHGDVHATAHPPPVHLRTDRQHSRTFALRHSRLGD